MEISALALEPQAVPRVWGGPRLARFTAQERPDPIGELWLAYDENLVSSPPFTGRRLNEVLLELGPAFLGPVPYGRYGSELPLLIKFLDTAEWLSVQVHPDDAYAHTTEAASGFHGKTEAWYVLEGTSELVYGLKHPMTREELRQGLLDGSAWEKLHRVDVGPGEVIFVPAGTIHALGPGLLIYEVQQRSDLTYRLYDYGRGRELHLEKGLAVSRLEPTPVPRLQPYAEGPKEILLASRAFVLERHRLQGSATLQAPWESFLLLTPVRGQASWEGRALRWGETLLIGAGKQVRLGGDAEVLGAFIPSPERLEGYPSAVQCGSSS
ncbi:MULTISPECIES: type I phosphomannose isomerase catalytic subunit [unclassified Meiothermus]|uniref:type I phosphomannose isomerase catalytic subunit n=1 Tax=unclassified Meiothermus TaxID=370471 RepID=UPI00157F83FC|nr:MULTISPECIES: type I phosphomannose isomerase catalytic subunit [unclassified Meiothermus]